ncbi:DUF4421 family protein [uncultured Flavobacterium sp.]|uniref:DUF4421 family protein n=1 Tax=uncultured Flavobacterium sp. TaxID=165435 RepID=UPI00292F107C|nr:DUF4421 family protein [uncultured Flavobacterium sp.]
MNLKIISIVFFTSVSGCFAQSDSLQNPYKKSYSDKITTSIYYLDTSNNFQIESKADGQKLYIDLIPDRREQLGLTVSYKFIDISIGFSPKFFDINNNTKSKHFNFGTRLYYKKWMQSFTFINQKGFHALTSGVQVDFPRMRTTKIGGTTSYIFNDKFSFKALTDQNEWQTKSAGSFIPTFSFYYTNIDLNDPTDPSTGNMYVFSLAPSYFYNWVINKRFLVGSGIAFGAGINDMDGDVSALYQLDLNLKLAYNTDRIFAYAALNNIAFLQSNSATERLNDNISTLKISVGYRFNTPKKVKEVYDKVNKGIGL